MSRIATLLSGHSLAAVFTLLRNLAIARLLGPEDYGLAVALAVITAAAEMATTLGLPQLIISHAKGGAVRFQAALHAIQIARGVLGAGVVLLCASPLAKALDAPESTPLFQVAALIPVILGFMHLDPFRAQRHRRHLPQTLVLAVPAATSVVLLWPVSHWQSGPEVMLTLLLVQACVTVVTSHLVAGRRYRPWPQAGTTLLALRFGLPLAANGALLFATLHAEKLIAGASLGLATMGVLAMGFTLTITPALIMARSFQAYHLPKLRRHKAEDPLGIAMLLGATLAVTLILLVPFLLPGLGAGYADLLALLPTLGCLAALRLPKSALATTALAEGRTHLPALANLPRLLAAPLIWVALANGGTVETLLTVAIIAEVLGVILGIWWSGRSSLPTKEISVAASVLLLLLIGQGSVALLVCVAGWLMRGANPVPQAKRRAA